jgi:2-C-methyl-D-erythritol 4-phosphate cytidylyltransferase
MKLAVIIAAAGRSTRFGFGDKLAQDLSGRAVLLRSVEVFVKRPETCGIVVAAPPDEIEGFKDRYGAQLGFHGATVVPGGRTERWETVRNALAAIPEDATHVAIHDGARPNVGPELLDRILDAARVHPAVIPGVRISSTLKRIGEDTVKGAQDDAIADAILGDIDDATGAPAAHLVEATIPRTNVISVQTPQVFTRELLVSAYEQADIGDATDDAMLVERMGQPVVAVEGDPANIKITSEHDLELLRRLVR